MKNFRPRFEEKYSVSNNISEELIKKIMYVPN